MDIKEIEEKYKELYPDTLRLYGPYTRKQDNRKHVVVYTNDHKRTSKQYAKVLLEIKEQRQLRRDETVDHIDGDFLNDSLDNLQLISRAENAALSAPRRKEIKSNCVWCGNELMLKRHNLANINNHNKAGPFCGRSCAGKYGAAVQNGRMEGDYENYLKVEYNPT